MLIPRILRRTTDDDEKPGDAPGGAWLRFRALTDQPNMIQMPQVAITSERPASYADLNSIRQDLDYVKAAAEATIEMISRVGERSDSETFLARALWESAIISYRRSFTSGRSHLAEPRASRPTLNDALAGLDKVLVDTHTEMLEQANRHFAHRVNRLQDLKVLVLLTAPPEPPFAAGLGPFSISFICPRPTSSRRS